MKSRIIQFIPFAITLLLVGFRYFSLWCTDFGHLCYRTWIDRIFIDAINPICLFSIFFLPIAIILIFISRGTFNAWLKLAAWAIPLSIFYIATTPAVDTSFLPFHRDDAARLAGGVFATVSLILIIWRVLRSVRAK